MSATRPETRPPLPADALIVDASSLVADALARRLAADGAQVEKTQAADLDAMLAARPGVRAVFFDIPALDEDALLREGLHEALCEGVEHGSLAFVLALRAAVKHLMTRAPAQIWVLLREDSFRYHMPVAAAPVLSQLRISTVRTVAKEVARFGLRLNVAVLHYGAEELPADTWRAGREGLKCYAQRYKPFALADMVEHLVSMAGQAALPVHGAVMQIGSGALENNL